MGNHTAGDLINAYATQFAAQRTDGETALDVLDKAVKAAKSSSGFTPDVEFEASDPDRPGYTHPEFTFWTDPHPKAVLGMLMVEAFAPNGLADLPKYTPASDSEEDSDDAYDLWETEVGSPFNRRYELC
jgi:hypothetical protein